MIDRTDFSIFIHKVKAKYYRGLAKIGKGIMYLADKIESLLIRIQEYKE